MKNVTLLLPVRLCCGVVSDKLCWVLMMKSIQYTVQVSSLLFKTFQPLVG